MVIWGKILGALFGFMLGGSIGSLIGIFLGHKFDKARQRLLFGDTPNARRQNQNTYFFATFAVMGHVAKSKGQVTQNEIRLASALMDRMGLQGVIRQQAQDAFRKGKESGFPLDQTLKDVKRLCAGTGRSDLLQFFLEVQIQAAYADGAIHPSELQVLHSVAQNLGFSQRQLEERLAMHEASSNFYYKQGFGGGSQQWQNNAQSASALSSAYKLLGVSDDAEPQTIKRAYRKAMNEHHPDKLAAKGLPPEMMEMAKQKAQQIQSAYDLIKKVKNL